MVARCQELLDAVKEQERELSAEVRSVYKDAEQVIENEKRTFRAGYEDRLQKVFAASDIVIVSFYQLVFNCFACISSHSSWEPKQLSTRRTQQKL